MIEWKRLICENHLKEEIMRAQGEGPIRDGFWKQDILNGVIWRQILILFFPILIGSFFQQLYSMVDSIVIGHAVGTNALASVGATGSIISLLVGLFVGISGGATVVIAQFYGAKDADRMHRAVHTAIAMSLAGSVLLMAIGIPTARPLLKLMKVPDEILDDAVTYMVVYYAGITGSLVYNIGTGILRSVGDSRTPLYILIVCCIVNIVLDLLFVLAFHWDVFGVAFATILSQLVSAILVLLVLMKTDDLHHLVLRDIRFDGKLLKEIIRIGIPGGMESVAYSISNVLIQTAINSFGTVAIASWSAIGRVDGIVWMVQQALAISVSTIVGQNFGAARYDRIKDCGRVGLWMSLAATGAISVILIFFNSFFLRIFTDDQAVIELGGMFIQVLGCSYWLYVFINNYSAVIRGAGETVQGMVINIIFICVLRTLFLMGLEYWPQFHTVRNVALSYPVSWVITSAIFIVYYHRGKWMKRCMARQQKKEGSAA